MASAEFYSASLNRIIRDRNGEWMEAKAIGPYIVVDADTKRPIRVNRFTSLDKAFKAGDDYVHRRKGDYIVLDRQMKPVARPR